MGKLFLTLVLLLQAATVAGAVDDASYKNSPVGKRSLSQSLLDSFFMMPRPRVDRCRGEMKIEDETGEKIPAVVCDFNVPKNYNSTADIQLGSCHDIDEPVCGEKLDDIYCDGPFVLSGNIRTVTYPEIHQYELNSAEFNHTYCARADVYNDVDGSGKQMLIASAKREVVITFIGGNVDEYMVDMGEEEGLSERGSPMAALIGSIIGVLIVVAIVAFFTVKRRNGGIKIHDSTNMEDCDDGGNVKDSEIEIV